MTQKEIHELKWWVVVVILLLGCKPTFKAPDVSHIQVDLTVHRIDEELWNTDTSNLRTELNSLFRNHPVFSDIYFNQILASPEIETDLVTTTMHFLLDPNIREMFSATIEQFSDFSQIEDDLVRAFQYYKYYFQDAEIPEVYTCVTGLGVGAFTIGEGILGIGLEFYLGEGYPMYNPQLFPYYIQRTMNQDHLVAKAMQALIEAHVGEANGIRMIDFMIRNGKVLYLKQITMPFQQDTVILEFTPEQIDWLEEHESQIWAHILESELLYETDYQKFQKLVSPSPNAPNMPAEAPGRTGDWIGLQIIRSNMARHPEMSPMSMLSENDAQKILSNSGYKPRR